jgi:hypothetical protein
MCALSGRPMPPIGKKIDPVLTSGYRGVCATQKEAHDDARICAMIPYLIPSTSPLVSQLRCVDSDRDGMA